MVRRRSILKESTSNDSTYIGDATETGENPMNNTFGVNATKAKRRVSFNNSMFVRPIAKVGDDPADFEGVMSDYQQPTYFKSAEEISGDCDAGQMSESESSDKVIPPILPTSEEQCRESHSLGWGSSSAWSISSIGLPSEEQSPIVSFRQLKRSSSVGSVCNRMNSLNVNSVLQMKSQMETVSLKEAIHNSASANELQPSDDKDWALVSFLSSPPLPVELTQGDDLNKSRMPQYREQNSPSEALKSSQGYSILTEISAGGPEANMSENNSLSQNLKKLELSPKAVFRSSETLESDERAMDKGLYFLDYPPDESLKTQPNNLQNANGSKDATMCISGNVSELFASPVIGDEDSGNKENVPLSESSTLRRKGRSKPKSSNGRVWPPKAINLSDRSVSPKKKSPLEKLKSLAGNQIKPGSGITKIAPKSLNYESKDARTCDSIKPVPIYLERFGGNSCNNNKLSQDVIEQLNFEQTLPSRSVNLTVIDQKLPEKEELGKENDLKSLQILLSSYPSLKETHWPKFDSCKVLGCLRSLLEKTCVANCESFGECNFVQIWKDLDEGADTKIQDALKKFKERLVMEKRLKNLKSQASKERYVNIDPATNIIDYMWYDKENVEFVYDNSLQVNIKFNKPEMKTTEFTVVKLPGSTKYRHLYLDGACRILLQPQYTIGYDLSSVLQFTIEFLNKSLLPVES